MRADTVEGETAFRYPIRGTFIGCCASAMIATANSIAATKIDDQPTFFIAYIVTKAITQAAIVERIIYGRRKKRFVEGKKASFYIGLN